MRFFVCTISAVLALSVAAHCADVEEFSQEDEDFLPTDELSTELIDAGDSSVEEIEEPEVDVDIEPAKDLLRRLFWHYHYHYNYHHHHEHEHDEGGCKCSGKSCSCCVTDRNFHIHVNGKQFTLSACVDVEYLDDAEEYEVSVKFNGMELLNKRTIDLEHPPCLCYGVPRYSGVKACVEFYDVSEKHACVKVKGKVNFKYFSFGALSFDLGCFTIPEGMDQ